MSTATLSPFIRMGRQEGRHSLDEWAARQAREMVSSIETHNMSDEMSRRSFVSHEGRYAIMHSGYRVPNVRTATLVQMWREIEAEANGRSGKSGSSRSGSPIVNGSVAGEHLVESDGSDFADDQSADSEGVLLRTPIARGVSTGGENEKGKVADAVRRFTAAIEEADSREQTPRFLVNGSREQTPRFPVIGSREQTPRLLENGSGAMFDQVMNQSGEVVEVDKNGVSYKRIRGTRVFKEFFIQLVGQRRSELSGICERRLVSEFAHRSRIQSLLKVRYLSKESKEVMSQGKKNSSSSSVKTDKMQSGTSVLLLRQKFNCKEKNGAHSNSMLENDRSTEQEMHLDSPSLDDLKQISLKDPKQVVKKSFQPEESIRMKGMILEPSKVTMNQAVKEEECKPSSGYIWSAKSSCNDFNESHGNEGARGDNFEIDDSKKNLNDPSETRQHSCTKASSTGVLREELSSNCEMEQLEKGQLRVLQSCLHSNVDYSSCDPSDTSEDTFPSISNRPEEDIRIREVESQVSCSPLSVSEQNCEEASSSLDVQCCQRSLCIDHLNWDDRYPFQQRSKTQNTTDWVEKLSKNVALHELYERKIVSTALASEFKDRLELILLNILKKQEQESISEEHELSLCHSCPDNCNCSTPKSDQIVVESFDRYDEQNHHRGNHSVEMDLILELRRDIARLRQEVSDMKRIMLSCSCCTDKQLELQRCIEEGVYPTEKSQIVSSGKMSKQATSHFNCCIFCESQVDSVFYKCGHTCACYNCAYDLQTKKGCCPICHALVVDVVRVQSNS